MSCACENTRMGRELERFRRIAKVWAQMENDTAIIYQHEDGSYGFASISVGGDINGKIIEYITPY